MPSPHLIGTPELAAAFERGRQLALTDIATKDYFDPRNRTFNRGTILQPVPWGDIAYVALGREEYDQIKVSEGRSTLAEVAGRIEAVTDVVATWAIMAHLNETPLRQQDRVIGLAHDTVPVPPHIIIERMSRDKTDG